MYGTSLLSSPFPIPSGKTLSATANSRHLRCRITMSLDETSTGLPNLNLIKSVTKLLWGKSLPPQILISTVRSTWSTAWQLMMSQMAPSDTSGRYTRPASQFRVAPDANELSRQNLHLYVGLPCPWAHRTLIVRALKGLEDAVPVSIASPGIDGSWEFRDCPASPQEDKLIPSLDKANGCKTLKEVYNLRRGRYNGRSTVPMLWDAKRKDVICNESYDIIELFNSGLNEIALNPKLDLSPPSHRKRINEWNQIIYPKVNNGVYRYYKILAENGKFFFLLFLDNQNVVSCDIFRCGFAQSQEAYDAAVRELFSTLDSLDDHLGRSRYLCGHDLTLADVCLFTTLIRFDIVYNVLFKCTKKKLIEYPNLHGYMQDIYQVKTFFFFWSLE